MVKAKRTPGVRPACWAEPDDLPDRLRGNAAKFLRPDGSAKHLGRATSRFAVVVGSTSCSWLPGRGHREGRQILKATAQPALVGTAPPGPQWPSAEWATDQRFTLIFVDWRLSFRFPTLAPPCRSDRCSSKGNNHHTDARSTSSNIACTNQPTARHAITSQDDTRKPCAEVGSWASSRWKAIDMVNGKLCAGTMDRSACDGPFGGGGGAEPRRRVG